MSPHKSIIPRTYHHASDDSHFLKSALLQQTSTGRKTIFLYKLQPNKLFKTTKYKMCSSSHRISNQTLDSFPAHAKIYYLSQIWQTTVDAAAVTAKMLALCSLTIHHDTSDFEGKSITKETIWEPLPDRATLPNAVFRQLRSLAIAAPGGEMHLPPQRFPFF